VPAGMPQSALPTFGDTIFVAGHVMPDNTTVRAYGFRKFLTPDK
jgi:hypothetical protein